MCQYVLANGPQTKSSDQTTFWMRWMQKNQQKIRVSIVAICHSRSVLLWYDNHRAFRIVVPGATRTQSKHILKRQSLQPRPCTMSVCVCLCVWSLDGFLLFNYFIALWQEFLAIPWDLIGWNVWHVSKKQIPSKDLSAWGKGWTDPFANDCDFKIVKNMWGGAAIVLLWLWWRWQISVFSKSYNIHKYHLDWNNFKRQMNRVWQ